MDESKRQYILSNPPLNENKTIHDIVYEVLKQTD